MLKFNYIKSIKTSTSNFVVHTCINLKLVDRQRRFAANEQKQINVEMQSYYFVKFKLDAFVERLKVFIGFRCVPLCFSYLPNGQKKTINNNKKKT